MNKYSRAAKWLRSIRTYDWLFTLKNRLAELALAAVSRWWADADQPAPTCPELKPVQLVFEQLETRFCLSTAPLPYAAAVEVDLGLNWNPMVADLPPDHAPPSAGFSGSVLPWSYDAAGGGSGSGGGGGGPGEFAELGHDPGNPLHGGDGIPGGVQGGQIPVAATGLGTTTSAAPPAAPQPSVPTAPVGPFNANAPSPTTTTPASTSSSSGQTATRNDVALQKSSPPKPPQQGAAESAVKLIGNAPIHFERNQGQAAAGIQFVARGAQANVSLAATEAVITLRKAGEAKEAGGSAGLPGSGNLAALPGAGSAVAVVQNQLPSSRLAELAQQQAAGETAVVHMQLVGANATAQGEGLDQLRLKTNYLNASDPTKSLTNIANFGRVVFHNVYDRIDLAYHADSAGRLEYDFILGVGANINDIQLAFEGAESVSSDADGNLIVHTAGGDFVQHAPVVYQEAHGARQAVAGGYVVGPTGKVTFDVAAYDTARPLVIDPVLAFMNTFEVDSSPADIAVDAAGNTYLTGTLLSDDIYAASLETFDAYIVKFDSSGEAIYETVLKDIGGSPETYGLAIAVDAGGCAYVSGIQLTEIVPVGEFGILYIYGAFAAKVNAAGDDLAYASVFADDRNLGLGMDIAIDGQGCAYVTGQALSLEIVFIFPIITGSVGIAAKLDAGGAVLYCNELGEDTVGVAIAADEAGCAYVTGQIQEIDHWAGGFPVLHGVSVFFIKLDANGDEVYNTSLENSFGTAIAVDSAGCAYLAIEFVSFSYPEEADPVISILSAYAIKLDPSGETLVAGYAMDDSGIEKIVPDGQGGAYATGITWSGAFQTTEDAAQASYGGNGDAFFIHFDGDGELLFATYLGDTDTDCGFDIAVGPEGEILVAGFAPLTDFSILNIYQVAGRGASGAFVAKFWPTLVLPAPGNAQTFDASYVAIGPALVDVGTGSVVLIQPLDLDRSPASPTFGGEPALVYNSAAVGIPLIIQSALYSDPTEEDAPTGISASIDWDGGGYSTPLSYTPTGGDPGDKYYLGLQGDNPVAATGYYSYSAKITVTYDGSPQVFVASRKAVVLVEGADNPFGYGWSLAGLDRLIEVDGGVLYVSGAAGSASFFKALGDGEFLSPVNDFGKLHQNLGGSYSYTAKDQLLLEFDADGYETRAVDPHGLARTFTYDDGKIYTIADPDGSIATFSYSTGKLASIAAPGGRTYTATVSSDDLTALTNPDGGALSFSYNGSHQVTGSQYAPLGNVAYGYYPSGTVGTVAFDGATTTILSASQATLDATPAPLAGAGVFADATVTDALNRTTTYSVDIEGRVLRTTVPDGGIWSYAYDAPGHVISETDPLGRLTRYTYKNASGKGDLVGVTTADGAQWGYGYNGTYHHLTSVTDPLGNTTSWGYNGSGDLTSVTDALGKVSTYVPDATGLTTVAVDANLGRLTMTYDAARRVETITSPGPARTTFLYDAAGNATVAIDALGNRVTTAYDAMRRATGVQWPGYDAESTAYDYAGSVTAASSGGVATTYSYNGRGLPTGVTFGAGGIPMTTAYSYDAVGNATVVTDSLGNLTTYLYDVMDRVTGTIETTAAGLATSSTFYDLAGNVTGTLDAAGRATEYFYDAVNRQTGTQTVVGGITMLYATVYDLAGRVTSTTDGEGRTTQYVRDPLGRAVITIDSAEGSTEQLFDPVGNVTGVIDTLGQLTQYQYDPANRQIVTIDPATGRTTTLYDLAGHVTGVRDSLNNLTKYLVDAAGRPTVTIDALNGRTTSSYDGAGRMTAQESPAGTSQFLYDANGRQTVTVSPGGARTTVVLDGAGRASVSIDARSARTTTLFDQSGRATVVIDALLNRTTTLYDLAGNVTGVQDARTNLTQYLYDGFGRQTVVVDGLGKRTTSFFDLAGNLTGTKDANLNLTQHILDSAGRETVTVDGAGNRTTATLDAAGHRTVVEDPNHNLMTYLYDAMNRLTVTIAPGGGRETRLYDAAGNMTYLKDAVNNVSTFAYDALNRVTSQTDPLGNTATFLYNAASLMTSTTDRNGNRRDFQYDSANRLTTETWSGGGINSFTYDANGNQLTARNANGAYTYVYDALNRATVVTDVWGKTLTFTFDEVGNRIKVQDSFGGVETSTYDANNRLSMREFAGITTTVVREEFTYENNGLPSHETRYSDLAGSVKVGSTTYLYDAASRVTAINHYNGSNTVLTSFIYNYDPGSRLTSEVINGVPQTYSYDTRNELTADGTHTYTYDAEGNRNNGSWTSSTGNQLTSDGTWTYSYDFEGNLTKRTKGVSAETWTYGYNQKNQLIWAEDRATDAGTLLLRVDYKYDVYGNRIQKAVDSNGDTTVDFTERYALDGWDPAKPRPIGNENWDVWADLNGSSSLTTRYLRGDAVDQLLARIGSTGTAAWLLTDHLGSIVGVTDNSGGLQDVVTYDGFGNFTETHDNWGGRYKWTGREADTETGFQYNRDRYYYSVIASWISQDPAGFAAGDANLYRYVHNGFTNATDPSGKAPVQGLTAEQFAKLSPAQQEAVLQKERNEIAQYRTAAAAAERQENLKWFLEAVAWQGFRPGAPPNAPPPMALPAATPQNWLSAFFGSLGDSASSIGGGLWGTVLLGIGDPRANQVLNQAYQRGPFGQTENGPAWAYYGTRGAIGVATGAMAAYFGARITGFNPVVIGRAAPATAGNAARIAQTQQRLEAARESLRWNIQQAEHSAPGTELGNYFAGRITGLRAEIEGLETALRALLGG